jgi:hypothetical protein
LYNRQATFINTYNKLCLSPEREMMLMIFLTK